MCETCVKAEVLSFFQTYAMEIKSWDDTDTDYIVDPAIRNSDVGKMLVGEDSTARNVAEWHIFPQLFHTTDLLGQGQCGRAPLINEARFYTHLYYVQDGVQACSGIKPKNVASVVETPLNAYPTLEDVLMNGQHAVPNVRYRLWSESSDISHYRRVTLHHTLLNEVEERMRGGGGGGGSSVRGGGIQKASQFFSICRVNKTERFSYIKEIQNSNSTGYVGRVLSTCSRWTQEPPKPTTLKISDVQVYNHLPVDIFSVVPCMGHHNDGDLYTPYT